MFEKTTQRNATLWRVPSGLFNRYILISGFHVWRWVSVQSSFASQFYLLLVNYFKKRRLNNAQAAELNIPPRGWCFRGTSTKQVMYHSDMSAYRRATRRSLVRALITSFLSPCASSMIVPRKRGLRISCLTPTDIILNETGIEVRQKWKVTQ